MAKSKLEVTLTEYAAAERARREAARPLEQRLRELHVQMAALTAELWQQVETVETQLRQTVAPFEQKKDELRPEILKLAARGKKARKFVKIRAGINRRAGWTVTSWNTKRLEALARQLPEINEARKDTPVPPKYTIYLED
ncbi:MAG: hypothetical protein FOGNACKC_00738 [Anaerolineae bacterium]|nr:hypothetical protein [Anaerolineae bacterium]